MLALYVISISEATMTTAIQPKDTAADPLQTQAMKIVLKENEALKDALARVLATPQMRSIATALAYTTLNQTADPTAYLAQLDAQVNAIAQQDTSLLEATLLCQLSTLDIMFNNFALRASENTIPSQVDLLTRLALKAQAQSRATIEALAALKNPHPVSFVRQTNIAQGPQQINNAVPSSPGSSTQADARLLATQPPLALVDPLSVKMSKSSTN
ncbi:hypothetical protein [Silvimonas iriomotensis]|uniref:Uncharacterized protein n=1 Tax=Silvimonas iriomotensis TaxID=449662 RepID=A0ABQ2PCT4_9NEIS|nr:hypothetical protein [Silvimonas iriomotensis]GGP23024.1 hypothetical protein GCM10010970_30240 [Silvimonas iriomotensis]